MDNSIFSLLNSNFKNWSIKNAYITDIAAESMIAMTVELTIEEKTCVGIASIYKDFSKDVTEQLLEKAVYSAYNKIFSSTKKINDTKPLNISKELLLKVNEFKKKYNVTNDTIFNDYIAMWNKTATKNTLLTVQGALESFLDFIDKLEDKQ